MDFYFAATQDIAIDGYTVETLAESEYRLGSMAQSIGVALGSMIGGAATLWLYQHYGWQAALLTLAVLTALTMLAISQIKERPQQTTFKQPPSLKNAFKRPEIRWALLLILCYRFVEAPAMAMLNPMLIDQQWSLTEIGVLMSVFGALVGLLAAVTAAFLLKIGSNPTLIWAGWLRTLSMPSLASLFYSVGLTSGTAYWVYL